jgi:peptide/nickel transport system permease protein
MTTIELGELAFEPTRAAPSWRRLAAGLAAFARRKPLGFFGALVIVLIVICSIPPLTDWLAPYDYAKSSVRDRLHGSSSDHLLGTDSLGRDTLSRLIYGARVTAIVGFGAVALSETLSAVIGIVSGYFMGRFDSLSQRLVDFFQALPGLVIYVTIFGIFGSPLWLLVLTIGVIQGVPGSRIVRSQVLSIMASPYIEGARVVGAGSSRIMVRHVLPNVVPIILLGFTARIGFVILTEATLSFLGFGVQPPYPSWGQMLSFEGRQYMAQQPGLSIYPGVAIALAVFAFNVFGDALRDVWDPRLRGSR